MEIRKISPRRSQKLVLHVVVLQRTGKKYAKIYIYNVSAQPVFCSLNRLFGGVLVAVVILLCLISIIIDSGDKDDFIDG